MIKVVNFDDSPMDAQESRELLLTGNGPFRIKASCFVDNPPPPGFRPCAACGKQRVIRAMEPFVVSPDAAFPPGSRGRFSIDIEDDVGEQLHLEIEVHGRPRDRSGGMEREA
jgi:hypothetical protein